MTKPIDSKLHQDLSSHIETLTHTGQQVLDADLMKKVKRICKCGDGYVEHTYHLLLHQLREQHSEVRYSAFQIIDELFRRSHCFREILVIDMQRIMELTAETNPSQCLPPPKVAANNLKCLALKCFHEWNAQYGNGYKRLHIGYNFLKRCKNIDFSNLEFESSIHQARQQENLRKQQIVNEGKIKKVLDEYNDLQSEMKNTITSLDSCIELLVPSLEDFFIPSETVDDIFNDTSGYGISSSNATEKMNANIGSEDVDIREHGMNINFSVEVNIQPVAGVKENSENAAIFENARDFYRLINNRYLPRLKKWLQVMTKCSGKSEDIIEMVDLKETLEKSVNKCDKLNIGLNKIENDTSDSEFEEVLEKEDYEEDVVVSAVLCEEIPKNYLERCAKEPEKDWSIFSKENNEKDPTTLLSTLSTLQSAKKPVLSQNKTTQRTSNDENETEKIREIESVPSTSGTSQNAEKSRKEKLLAVAPKLPFDIDLYHWEEENLTAPTMLVVKPEGARFWSATSTDEVDEIAVPEGTASLRTRVIEFSGQHEPVKWTCRAPLPSGKLCPRRDRVKCPFHGPIVARNNTGKCTNPEDEAKLKRLEQEQQQKTPDWQDPKLLQEIKEATGVDLKMPEKGKRKKKDDKYPGLTDIKARQNNTYTRLAKKVFNKRTVKRVAQNLDSADHKRYRDKFGDQFNYVYNT